MTTHCDSVSTPPVGMTGDLLGNSPLDALNHLNYRLVGYEPRKIEVVRFDPSRHTASWETFIPETANGNLFHTRRFLNYHPPRRFVDHSLLFFDRGRLLAVAAGEENEGRWSAHRFSSHGGLCVLPGLPADTCLSLVWSLLRYGVDRGWTAFQMRFAPDSLFRGDLATLLWALEIFGFDGSGKELAWSFAPGVESESELEAGYSNGARGAVVKAQKGSLTFRKSDDFPTFWQLLERNLEAKFQVAPTHSLEEIERLIELCPGQISLWSVFAEQGDMLAGSVVFELDTLAAHTFYSAQDYDAQRMRPAALLTHGLALEYVVRRKKRLNLGVITAHGAAELNVGLSFNKQSFGTHPSIRRTYRLKFAD